MQIYHFVDCYKFLREQCSIINFPFYEKSLKPQIRAFMKYLNPEYYWQTRSELGERSKFRLTFFNHCHGRKWFCSQEVIPYRFVACIFVLKLQIRKSQERISENIQRKNFGFTKSHRFIRRKHPNSLSGSRLVYERVRRLRISEKSPLVRPY